MPYVDADSGNVVTRVVYDGPPEAGKTTNLVMIYGQVGETRAGKLYSPMSEGRQTEYFDWLEFPGGFLDGRRVRCQLLSVPGQDELSERRRLLLETADVIVFVVDARRDSVQSARRNLNFTQQVIQSSPRDIALLLQANKQDLEGALSPEEARRELGMPESMVAVGAASGSGEGVMYTFVMAARLAIDRARELLAQEESAFEPNHFQGADELLETMLAHDRQVRRAPNNSGSLGESMPGGVVDEPDAEIPDPARICAGHVWPPLYGRQHFARATAGSLRKHTTFIEEKEVLSISSSDGWRLHSFVQDVFDTEQLAHAELLKTAQRCQKYAEWIEPSLAIAIYRQEVGWRLWTVHRDRPSLREALVSARGEQARASLLDKVKYAERQLQSPNTPSWLLETVSLDGLTVDHQRLLLYAVRYMPHDDGGLSLSQAAAQVLDLTSHRSTIEQVGAKA